jgi:hypothetical protein
MVQDVYREMMSGPYLILDVLQQDITVNADGRLSSGHQELVIMPA